MTRLLLLLPLLALACGTTVGARPVGAGRTAIQASVGGPIVELFDLDLPAPILMVGAARGLSDRLDVWARGDVTAAAYGVAHLEPGAAWHLAAPAGARPGATVGGSLHLLTDLEAVRLAPVVSALASWALGRHLVYAGADAGLVIGADTRPLAGPLVGAELALGRLGLSLEARWLAPWVEVEPLAPTWISPGGQGFLSVLVGARWRVGR